MAKKKYDSEDGVWRTVGGRRIFIRNGQDLSSAMKESGKFKNMRKDVANNVKFKDMKEDTIKREGVTAKEYQRAEDRIKEIREERDRLAREEEDLAKNQDWSKEPSYELEDAAYHRIQKGEELREAQQKYEDLMKKDGHLERKYKMPTKNEEYELYKRAKENPDSIDPMTENSTDWEALDKKYSGRYKTEKIREQISQPVEYNYKSENLKEFSKRDIRDVSNEELIRDEIKNFVNGGNKKETYLNFTDRMEKIYGVDKDTIDKRFQHVEDNLYYEKTGQLITEKRNKTYNRNLEELKKYQERMLNDDNYLQANRPNVYFNKTIKETPYIKTLEKHNLNDGDSEFKRAMLGRMESDINYYLGNGSGYAGHLWAKDEEEQINIMKALYNTLPEKEKPDWINEEKIEEYSKMMQKLKSSDLKTRFKSTYEYMKNNTTMSELEILEYLKKYKDKKNI